MPNQISVLVTRPEPGATDFSSILRRTIDGKVFSVPLTKIVPVEGTVEAGDATVILISSPKAAELAPSLPELPVIAVGRTSAEAAKARGLKIEAAGSSKVDDTLIAAFAPDARVLHISGADLAVDPAPLFHARGISYTRSIVYRADEAVIQDDEFESFLNSSGDRYVTFLSVRAVDIFAHHLSRLNEPAVSQGLRALCLSPRIGDAAEGKKMFEKVLCSDSAEPAQFVDFIKSHCT